jgi:hypothetical protein
VKMYVDQKIHRRAHRDKHTVTVRWILFIQN